VPLAVCKRSGGRIKQRKIMNPCGCYRCALCGFRGFWYGGPHCGPAADPNVNPIPCKHHEPDEPDSIFTEFGDTDLTECVRKSDYYALREFYREHWVSK